MGTRSEPDRCIKEAGGCVITPDQLMSGCKARQDQMARQQETSREAGTGCGC